jgi:hypothetical protein
MKPVSDESQDLNPESIFLTNAHLSHTFASNFTSTDLQYID